MTNVDVVISGGRLICCCCIAHAGWVMGFTTEPQHRGSVTSSVDKASARSTMSSTMSSVSAGGDALAAAKIVQLRLVRL